MPRKLSYLLLIRNLVQRNSSTKLHQLVLDQESSVWDFWFSQHTGKHYFLYLSCVCNVILTQLVYAPVIFKFYIQCPILLFQGLLLGMQSGVFVPAAAAVGLFCRGCFSRVHSLSCLPRQMSRWNSRETCSTPSPQENPRILITGNTVYFLSCTHNS